MRHVPLHIEINQSPQKLRYVCNYIQLDGLNGKLVLSVEEERDQRAIIHQPLPVNHNADTLRGCFKSWEVHPDHETVVAQ